MVGGGGGGGGGVLVMGAYVSGEKVRSCDFGFRWREEEKGGKAWKGRGWGGGVANMIVDGSEDLLRRDQ